MIRYFFYSLLFPLLLSADTIKVKTRAPQNQQAVFQYRVPRGYDPRKTCRVLVIFGGRNTDGKADASGRMGWGEWCDKHNIFLVAPGLKNDDYWEPRAWSGRALLYALAELKKKYNICTDHLLFYGYSAGSQASNLFPAWRPDLCRAWVSHACGVFHTPSPRMRDVPGLVTCGDADQARYIISRNFVENARRQGCSIIWKTYNNLPHQVPMESLKLARAFLLFHHEQHLTDLGQFRPPQREVKNPVFVGDDQEQKFYPVKSSRAKNIFAEDRVFLPTLAIAQAWGKPGR